MIRLIAAVDKRNGIAKNGQTPWDLPDDRVYFARQTKLYGGNVLTGKQTYLSAYLGPLPDRQNFILTHSKSPIAGTTLVNDLKNFLNTLGQDLWVAGGESVYRQVLDLNKADEIYLTQIDADFGCDQFFPDISQDFEPVESSELKKQNGLSFSYAKYVRKSA